MKQEEFSEEAGLAIKRRFINEEQIIGCQSARNGDPGSACNRDPSWG